MSGLKESESDRNLPDFFKTCTEHKLLHRKQNLARELAMNDFANCVVHSRDIAWGFFLSMFIKCSAFFKKIEY